MSRLGPCPLCEDPGPWTTAAARAAHIRAHHTADCGLCGQPVNASGFDAHMRYVHGDEPAAPEPEPVPPAPDVALAEVSQAPGPPETGAEDAESASLQCPDCDADPFADRRRLSAHRRSHQEVACDECGKKVKGNGLGPHLAVHRRAAASADRAPARRALAAALTAMLPGAARDLVDRLTEFVDQAKEKPEPGLWIVAPLNGTRPWLCRAAGIGLVVAREHAASLVVSVDDIYAELNPPGPGDTSTFHAGQSWPHPKAKAS